jgi:hypothetical protein
LLVAVHLATLKQDLFAQVRRFKYNQVRNIAMVMMQHPVAQHGVHGQINMFIRIAQLMDMLVLKGKLIHLLLVAVVLLVALLMVGNVEHGLFVAQAQVVEHAQLILIQ